MTPAFISGVGPPATDQLRRRIVWSLLLAAAVYLVLTGLGVSGGLSVAPKAQSIFSIGTVIGAVGATPGGMGWIEGGLVGLSGRL